MRKDSPLLSKPSKTKVQSLAVLAAALTASLLVQQTPASADSLSLLEKKVANAVQISNESNSPEDTSFHSSTVTPSNAPQEINAKADDLQTSIDTGIADVEIAPEVEDGGEIQEVESSGITYQEAADGVVHLRSLKSNGDVQYGSVLDTFEGSKEIVYDIDLPRGSTIETDGKAALVLSESGEFIGGFEDAWALDADGNSVSTTYKVDGHRLIQVIDAGAGSPKFPIVADPVFKRGMIKKVTKEKWEKGGWVVQVKVAAAARLLRLKSVTDVAMLGYKDLVEHYSRSMKKATMRQQWDCHVLGLYGTFTIDLEGYRKSKPNWQKTEIKKAVIHAFKKKDARAVARACNW